MQEGLRIVSQEQTLTQICGEYLEMPGLQLTLGQAQRLWALDERTCVQLLEFLVDVKFLCRARDGKYARLTEGAARFPPLWMAKVQLDSTPATPRAEGAPSAA